MLTAIYTYAGFAVALVIIGLFRARTLSLRLRDTAYPYAAGVLVFNAAIQLLLWKLH